MHILIAEDDRLTAAALQTGLREAGYQPTLVSNGQDVLPALKRDSFSLLLLDVMLPGLNGFQVCDKVRREKLSIPIIMITARDGLKDRVTGLDAGADDYLSKPFLFPELLARVRALLRRGSPVKVSSFSVCDLFVDTLSHSVRRGSKQIQLTPREYQLLIALLRHEGMVLSREKIATDVWLDEFTSKNTIEVHVKNLRRKIDDGFETKLIHTVYGTGYILRIEA